MTKNEQVAFAKLYLELRSAEKQAERLERQADREALYRWIPRFTVPALSDRKVAKQS